ncbi:NnrS family protein [Metapseudomonas boanensis]|uniref:NnrS family protein n=1 Tax=Metapseudomonas boanensis TaxID=2822138 RepID=A0ABS5XLB4_9GAMM|nr:NnrS family protein [Pseudomonas boanensis]
MQVLDRSKALAIPPIWRLGFRPFFLSGAAFAILAIGLWAAFLYGLLPGWHPLGGSLAWHRHEMPFGFATAIIAGFLLTAVQSWTGQPGLSGRPLVLLFLVWLAARIAWFLPLPVALLVATQAAFLPLLAAVLGMQLWRVRQRRNYPVVAVLLLMAACQLLALCGLAWADDTLQRQGALGALWLVAALLSLIGGRVIPFFTLRGVGRPDPFPPRPWLDWLTFGCSLCIAGMTAAGIGVQPSLLVALLFLLATMLHGERLLLWHDRRIWQVPLLWSLHLAYAWLMLATLGMALWHAGLISQSSSATHALAVGAMGGLILAMIARVSLGHTGRPLSPPAAMVWAFVLLQLAALSRVLLTALSTFGLWLSALAWIAAFLLFLRYYAPMLWKARVDGHPG